MSHAIYLDSNATTTVLPAAMDAAQRVMAQQFGNPSSSHSHGLAAKAVLEQARSVAAQVLGVQRGRLMFNSGATEGIQTAVLSALCALRAGVAQRTGETVDTSRSLLVYGATEHKAVPQSLAHWVQVLGLDCELRALPVNAQGLHDLEVLAQWLPQTAMLCTMAANNETGVVSDLAGIERLLRQSQRQALWLVDGVQALGKLDLQLDRSRIDYAVFSGHKLYAPKGVGMLYVREDAPYTPLIAGGGQEQGLRSGTENMPGIAALGAVLQALQRGDTFATHATLQTYRDALEKSLRAAFPTIVFNAPLEQSLPTTLNFSVPNVSSQMLVDVFDAAGLRVSAGSACSAAKAMPSEVLQAMGLPQWRTQSAVRLSIGAWIDRATVEAACQAIARCAKALAATARSTTPAAAQCLPQPTTGTALAPLSWQALGAFLQSHPQCCLVDVRDAAEFEVSANGQGHGLDVGGLRMSNIPLAELPSASWLVAHAGPVVFFCRSGRRSLQAAQWLQTQGHPSVHHIEGGLALRASANPV